MEQWERFAALFTGSDSAFGEWVVGRQPHPAKTLHGQPEEKHYREHLAGTIGLGIVPVNADGMCRFGAIDIDVDTIDHAALYKSVREREFPLTVCRSKSGGAHLYFFTGESGLAATQVQQLLGRWAAVLGYPTAEIFPKQKRADEKNPGNWINLPYFSGDNTTRYAVGPNGSLSLEEFFESVERYDPKKQVNDKQKSNAQLPPCLKKMEESGVTAGFRNQALFNYAVFYRKSVPEGWQKQVFERNNQFFSPPLSYREVGGIVTSLDRGKYQYTCDQSPIKEYCDKPVCMTLEFGVGHKPWDEDQSYDRLTVKNCRKLMTDPPKYVLEINGEDCIFSWDDFFTFKKFRSRIGQMLDIVVGLQKQPQWEMSVRELLMSKTEIAAPEDASVMGLIVEKLHEFLVLRERATEREDILRGLPVQDGDSVLFRMADFKRFLQGFKLDKVEGSELFLVLKDHGASHKSLTVNGRKLQVWAYPVGRINEQQEAFAVPDFRKDFEV